MKSRSKAEIRRARPLLGTIVDIACNGSSRDVGAAFATIENAHRLMSFHDPASDVSRMNRDAFPRGVIVHPWTWEVMKAAQRFARESNGVFDIAVAPQLMNWNYLPRDFCFRAGGSWRDIFLRRNCEVFFRRRVIVDLGGIAKGFAVDRAVNELRRRGVSQGIVNAGGDVRVFGSTSRDIHLRDPSKPEFAAGLIRARDKAVATSATYFSTRAGRTHLVHGQTRRALISQFSVTVAASDCMTADALTKIVFALREKAAPILARHSADALLIERDGSPGWMFQSSCDVRDQTQSN